VWDAYLKVAANKGAAGVDRQSIEEFERDLKGNLYKLWNRLSSGNYFLHPSVWWKYRNLGEMFVSSACPQWRTE
jgi:hypothetical protein